MPVPYELAALGLRAAEAQAVDHVAEAALELLQEELAGDALLRARALEGEGELPLQHAVESLHLLLLAELEAVALRLLLDAGPLAVLAGDVVALFDRALLREAAVALEEELHPLTAAKTTDGTGVSRHFLAP